MADINQLILQRIKDLGNTEAAKFFGVKTKDIVTAKRLKKGTAEMMAKMFEEFEVEQAEGEQPTEGEEAGFEVAEEIAQPPIRKGKGIRPAQHKARDGEAEMFTTPEGADIVRSLTRPAGSPTVVSPRDSGRRFSGVGRHGEDNVVTGRIAPRPGGHKTVSQCPPGVDPAMWSMFQMFKASLQGGSGNIDITGAVESDAPMQGNVLDNFPEEHGKGWNVPRNQQGPDNSQPQRGPQPRLVRRRQ